MKFDNIKVGDYLVCDRVFGYNREQFTTDKLLLEVIKHPYDKYNYISKYILAKEIDNIIRVIYKSDIENNIYRLATDDEISTLKSQYKKYKIYLKKLNEVKTLLTKLTYDQLKEIEEKYEF